MNIARLGHRPCVPQLRWTRFSGVAQIRGYDARKADAREAKHREFDSLTDEERLEMIEKQRVYADLNPLVDPWAGDTEALDYMIPYKTRYTNLQDLKSNPLNNAENWVKNGIANWSMMAYNAVPGRNLGRVSTWKLYTSYPFHAMKTTSLKPDTWLAPLRSIAKETYKELNDAVARRDKRMVKELAKVDYRPQVLDRLAKLPAKHQWYWQLHKDLSPLQILSIRCQEGYLALNEPVFGNRLVVQAVCRIETEQSLEMYDGRGKPLHTLEEGAVWTPGSRVAAQKRRVLEYLVLEKKMWLDTPWYFRDQLWPEAGREVKV